QDSVGALALDDLLDHLGGDRLDVGGVGELGVGHDRRGVGVDEHDPDPLLPQDAAGLGAGVVELAGLADDDRAGADDEEAGDVVALGHQAWFSLVVVRCASSSSTKRSKRWAASCGPAAPSGWYWTEKPRSRDPVSSRSSSPSTTSSLRPRWLTRARPKG